MKVLLIGGTGVMGSALAELISEKGADVYITSRKERKDKDNIHYIKCNVKTGEGADSIYSEKWDVILDFMMYYTYEFEKIYRNYMRCTKLYIFVSSSRVYADVKEEITEDSPTLLETCNDSQYLKTKDYALEKARQEKILIQSKYSNWTIIRPYITFGKNRFQLGLWEKEKWMYRFLKGRTIIFSKDLLNKITTVTYAKEVAQYILAIIENNRQSEIYNVVSDKKYTWSEILSLYGECFEEILKKEIKIKFVENIYQTGLEEPCYQYDYDRRFDRIFDNSKIRNISDNYIMINIKEALKKELFRFLENQEFENIDWKQEAHFDRITKERAKRNEFVSKKTYIKYLFRRYIKI